MGSLGQNPLSAFESVNLENKNRSQQGCIPVGCVPPAAVAGTAGGDLTRSPSTSPLALGLDQIPLNFPLGCGPRPDPPELPPWLWAWTRSPSISPLAVGLETPPPHDQAPPSPPWTEFLTHPSENITLPQTSFAGGNYCLKLKFNHKCCFRNYIISLSLRSDPGHQMGHSLSKINDILVQQTTNDALNV